jgi:hypothetical protein
MSMRMRKLLAPVFLLANPLVFSVANPAPTPNTPRLVSIPSPADSERTQNSNIPSPQRSARNDSRTACPAKPKLYSADRSSRPRKRGALHSQNVGEVGRTRTERFASSAGRARIYEEIPVTGQTDPNDSYDVFYDQLSADGHWIFAENYGYVFQPKLAENNPDWRPYTNGHWEATDRGWYWDTEEPFGWATYHYGRWANIDGTGWVWTPGIDWSPAWVSWRISENGFVGWAPLPPECPRPSEVVPIGSWCDSYADIGPEAFCFLPFNAWVNSSYVGLLAPAAQNLELVNASRNVTNISATKTAISNFGPHPDLIAQQTGREVKIYVLHYSEVRGRHNFSRSINGNLLDINGPAIKLKANATKVPTVIKTIVRPTINKGWNGLAKEDIDGVHRKYASEAHIPSRLPNKPIERVNLVPSATPALIRPVSDQKQKEPKERKEAAKATPQKGTKGKTTNASTHKGTAKHKTASESEEEGGSKGESKSKVKSKTAKASKDTEDIDESETPKKKTSSSKSSGGAKSAKTSKASKSSAGSKDEESKDQGSKGSKASKGEETKSSSKKSSHSSNHEESKGEGSKKSGSSKGEASKSGSKKSSDE